MQKIMIAVLIIVGMIGATETGCDARWAPVIVGSDRDYSQIIVVNCDVTKFDEALNEIRNIMIEHIADLYNLHHYMRGEWFMLCHTAHEAHYLSVDRLNEAEHPTCLARE